MRITLIRAGDYFRGIATGFELGNAAHMEVLRTLNDWANGDSDPILAVDDDIEVEVVFS